MKYTLEQMNISHVTHWQGVTIHGLITEVKHLWAQLVLGWVTVWDTLEAANNVIDTCHVLLWLIWAYKRFPECSPTHKKAGVCAVMSMYLVDIKEHVWSIWRNPTTILLSAMSKCTNKCCIERLNEKRYCLTWDSGPVRSPGSWSGRWWLPLKKSGMTQYGKYP